MSSFDSNGNYNKTNWKTGDKITADKLNKIEESLEIINNNDIERHKEVEADLEGLHAKDEELSEQLVYIENLNELKYNVKDFGVVGDGVTDDTEKLQQAIDSTPEGSTLYLQNKTYIVTSTLVVNKSINIIGEGKRIGFNSSGYGNGMTEIRKVNGDTNGDSVMFIDGSERKIESATFSNIVFSASNSNTITYDTAVLSTSATNNTSYALKATNVHGCYFENIGVRQAKEIGLYITSGAVNVFRYCNACNNYLGMYLGIYDSCIEHSWANHNITHGLLVKGNFMRVMNCRFEWNAQNGVKSENGEGTFVGNLFDRNGFAGLHLTSAWGYVVTGNYFCRNGAGGDGNIGRFGFSVPGHPSYIETPEEECCHIRMNYMRDVTISGNRFRAGKDDAGQGASVPCCIYYFSNVINCKTVGNAGEQLASSGFGGYTSHNLYEDAKIKKDSTSSIIFDYVESLPSTFNVMGSTNKELSEVTIPVSSNHMEIDIFGTKFQKTLRSKIIVNVGSSANILHVTDYGSVTVSADFDNDKQNVILTLSDKSWVRYNVKNFV